MSDQQPPKRLPPNRQDLAATQPLTTTPSLDATQPTMPPAPAAPAPTHGPDFEVTQPLQADAPLDATRSTMPPSPQAPPARRGADFEATQPMTTTPATSGTRGTFQPTPTQGGANRGPDFEVTRLIADTHPPKIPTHDPDATRPTVSGDVQDHQATLPRDARSDQATIAFKPGETAPFPEHTPPGSKSVPANATRQTAQGDRTPLNTGSLMRTSFTQRVSRTKLNQNLAKDAQELDAKLQISRPSVLADLAASREGEALPPGVRRLIEEQGTEGRYAINRELAHGGMGAVLDISDHDFRRKAAMKVILSRFARSPEAVERFLAEAQVTAQLEHPNIVPIHDLGVMEDGTLYFTMKMIEGQSLGKVVKTLQQDRGLLKPKDGEITAPDAVSKAATAYWTEQEKLHVFLKVLDGVGFAHARGVIHRDIKPDNIMLGGHGEVLVVDWGIAKILGAPEIPPSDQTLLMGTPGTAAVTAAASGVVSIRSEEASSATIAGSAMGTIYYMPPEQAQGSLEEMDARSDIYALGATLYELLSLKRCLVGTSLAEMLVMIVEGNWISLNVADPTINLDLVAIVHRAMARQSKNRYPSCDDFSADIRRYLAGQAVEARKRSATEILKLWISQNRKRIFATMGAILLAILVGLGTAWEYKNIGLQKARFAFSQAKSMFQSLPQEPSIEDVLGVRAQMKLTSPIAADPEVVSFNSTLTDAYSIAQFKEQERARREAKTETASKLIALAKIAADRDDQKGLTDALQDYGQAVALTPDDNAAQQALLEVKQRLSNRSRFEREQQLRTHAQLAEAALVQVEAMPRVDTRAPAALARAASELTLADSDHVIKIEGIAALATRYELLKEQVAAAVSAASDLKRGQDLAAQAKRELSENQLLAALNDASGALAFAPKDATVNEVYTHVVIAKTTSDEKAAAIRRRAAADSAADQRLQGAEAAMTELRRQQSLLAQESIAAQRLERSLVDRPLSDQKPAFIANEGVRAARAAELSSWSSCEDQCQQVLAMLEPWAGENPMPPQYLRAESLLAVLYHQRFQQAVRENQVEAIGLYRGLLSRADRFSHAFQRDLSDVAQITITGLSTTGPVIAQPLVIGPDTRLVASGKPMTMPVSQAVALAVGSWQFTSGDTMVSVALSPLHQTIIAWPSRFPSLPGLPMRYVPADLHRNDDGSNANLRPFFLGTTEVTCAQYLAFLTDPPIFKDVAKSYHHHVMKSLTDTDPTPILHMPTDGGGNPVYTLVKGGGEGNLAQITLGDVAPDLPINCLTRDDALAYCEWLSQKFKVNARLPLKSEFRFASNGDDPQRVYAWGPHFNGNFCVSSGTNKLDDRQPVGSNAFDVGPFGHHDLAGNVREWLGDQPTADDPHAAGALKALIACGGFGDDSFQWFKSDYSESVDPLTRYAPIGFRVLVEVP